MGYQHEAGLREQIGKLEAELAKEREKVNELAHQKGALIDRADTYYQKLAAAQATIAEMREALKVGADGTAVMADDWQTVPREPTDAMEQAGWDVEELRTPDKIYRAMLSAAPVPHNAEGQQEAACGRSAGPEC